MAWKVPLTRQDDWLIPKALREQAGLAAGTPLEITCREGKIEIEPFSPEVEIRREGTFWVAHIPGAPTLEQEQVNQILRHIREK